MRPRVRNEYMTEWDKLVRKYATGGLEYSGYKMENSGLRTVTEPVYALESDHNPSPEP